MLRASRFSVAAVMIWAHLRPGTFDLVSCPLHLAVRALKAAHGELVCGGLQDAGRSPPAPILPWGPHWQTRATGPLLHPHPAATTPIAAGDM
ncbi:hypothetical protein BBK14_30070 [Parafrankia soli]|uniref:Uncharacterized protein n=1 Tax=Parafrankia soli TaxID=2599596 RepID=A0A1S1RFV8_9ACTN|nr:hypothetical protein BBK14_30070 [Parafrankia soli]